MAGRMAELPGKTRRWNAFMGGLLGLLLALAPGCGSGGEVVRMGTEGAYPPFNFINEAGDLDGFELELGGELCRRAGLECTWVTNDWDTIIPDLIGGKYDTIMAGMSITSERDELIDFTHSYFPPSPSVYIALADADEGVIKGTVAAQVATIQADYLEELGTELMEVELADEVIGAVQSGHADAALADRDFLTPFLEESGGRLEIVGPEVLIGSGTGIGVREDDATLRRQLNEAIDEMKRDGSLNSLIIKWFGPDVPVF